MSRLDIIEVLTLVVLYVQFCVRMLPLKLACINVDLIGFGGFLTATDTQVFLCTSVLPVRALHLRNVSRVFVCVPSIRVAGFA